MMPVTDFHGGNFVASVLNRQGEIAEKSPPHRRKMKVTKGPYEQVFQNVLAAYMRPFVGQDHSQLRL